MLSQIGLLAYGIFVVAGFMGATYFYARSSYKHGYRDGRLDECNYQDIRFENKVNSIMKSHVLKKTSTKEKKIERSKSTTTSKNNDSVGKLQIPKNATLTVSGL